MAHRPDVSLLFDLFVVSQRMRRVLADGMAGSGMRPDEYAVYGLLFMYGPMTATEMAEQLGLPLSEAAFVVRFLLLVGYEDGPVATRSSHVVRVELRIRLR